jgi:hypothetical protein
MPMTDGLEQKLWTFASHLEQYEWDFVVQFPDTIVTSDEIWLHHHKPESAWQSVN